MASYRCTLRRMKIKRARGAAPGELVARKIAVFITGYALIIVCMDTGPRSCWRSALGFAGGKDVTGLGAVRCGAATGRLRPLTGAELGGCLLRLLTAGGCCGLCQPAGHLPGVTPADRVMVLAVAGHCRRRAVIVKAGEGEFVGGRGVAGGGGGHDVTAPVSGRCPVRPGGWQWAPAASTGYPTPRAP